MPGCEKVLVRVAATMGLVHERIAPAPSPPALYVSNPHSRLLHEGESWSCSLPYIPPIVASRVAAGAATNEVEGMGTVPAACRAPQREAASCP